MVHWTDYVTALGAAITALATVITAALAVHAFILRHPRVEPHLRIELSRDASGFTAVRRVRPLLTNKDSAKPLTLYAVSINLSRSRVLQGMDHLLWFIDLRRNDVLFPFNSWVNWSDTITLQPGQSTHQAKSRSSGLDIEQLLEAMERKGIEAGTVSLTARFFDVRGAVYESRPHVFVYEPPHLTVSGRRET